MKFVTNRISTGPAKTLDAFIKEAAAKKVIKTASVTKTAEESKSDKDGEMNVKMQPGDPCCGTDTGEIIEGDEKIEASATDKVKVAEKEKDEAKGVTHKTDPVGGTNTAKDETKVYPGKKAASPVASQKKAESDAPAGDKGDYNKIPNSGGRKHGPDECCGSPSSKGQDGSEGEKKEATSAAQTKNGVDIDWSKLRPIANLKPAEKTKVKGYFRNLYGEDYAESMVQDK
jgi:hypothetical protein